MPPVVRPHSAAGGAAIAGTLPARPRYPSARALAATAAALGVLPPLYAWAVRAALRHALRRLRAGDAAPLLRRYAPDVRFVFPGRSSWAADLRGRDAVARWLRRFVRAGLQLEPQEILVAGPPWATTVCVRYTDRCLAPGGEVVYRNRGVLFGTLAWGRVTAYEVHEDTEAVAAFDAWLAAHEPR